VTEVTSRTTEVQVSMIFAVRTFSYQTRNSEMLDVSNATRFCLKSTAICNDF